MPLFKHIGDLTQFKNVDYICNAANGLGPMGRGIAGAIKRMGGSDIERDAFKVCKKQNPQPGDIYLTTAGTLPYKKIIHLVTMKQPSGPTSFEIVEQCLKNLVEFCKEKKITKVALPGLSTGVGGLDKQKIAGIFLDTLAEIDEIEFHIVDVDIQFIAHL